MLVVKENDLPIAVVAKVVLTDDPVAFDVVDPPRSLEFDENGTGVGTSDHSHHLRKLPPPLDMDWESKHPHGATPCQAVALPEHVLIHRDPPWLCWHVVPLLVVASVVGAAELPKVDNQQ